MIKTKAKKDQTSKNYTYRERKFADLLETFRLMETFVLGKILNPIYQVAVSDSTEFEDLVVAFFTLVVSGHKRHV